jgi:hypothetical protein
MHDDDDADPTMTAQSRCETDCTVTSTIPTSASESVRVNPCKGHSQSIGLSGFSQTEDALEDACREL